MSLLVPWVALAASCGADAVPDGRPNLVIVAQDTTRWDHTSLSGYARDTTPNLAALADRPGAITFSRAYSAAPYSLTSYTSIFTGVEAGIHGVGIRRDILPQTTTTLAEVLQAYGYGTAGITAGVALHGGSGLERGFGLWRATSDLGSLGPSVDAALSWLDGWDGHHPFFLFVQGYDAHGPYRSPGLVAESFDPDYQGLAHDEPKLMSVDGLQGVSGRWWWADYSEFAVPAPEGVAEPTLFPSVRLDPARYRREPFTEADAAHVIAHYDAAISYADYHLGRLLGELEERKLLDSTLLVVLGDHGEFLGERGVFRHGYDAGDAVFHVPLVLRVPGRDPPRVEDRVVSLTNLMPTLLDMLGLRRPAQVVASPSLLSAGEGMALGLSSCCAWVRDRRFEARGVYDEAGGVSFRLYEDGREVRRNREQLEAMRKAVAHWPAGAGDPSGRGPSVADAQLREALRDAGYWARGPEDAQPAAAPPQVRP